MKRRAEDSCSHRSRALRGRPETLPPERRQCSSSDRSRALRGRSGFTLVEVVMSLGVMTVGAMAIFSLQQQLTRANMHARELSTATQIAQNWIERLKLDAVRWNRIGELGATTYLVNIGATGAIGPFRPIPMRKPTSGTETRFMGPAFDYYGRDLDTDAGPPAGLHYCASYRLNWVYANQRVIRADVRVFWAREGASILNDYPRCEDDDVGLNPGGANFERYHVVYLSTVIRSTPI